MEPDFWLRVHIDVSNCCGSGFKYRFGFTQSRGGNHFTTCSIDCLFRGLYVWLSGITWNYWIYMYLRKWLPRRSKPVWLKIFKGSQFISHPPRSKITLNQIPKWPTKLTITKYYHQHHHHLLLHHYQHQQQHLIRTMN